MYVKGRRGLSSVVGSLFLVVLVLVAWTFLFRYALLFVNSVQSRPDISLSSTVTVVNGGVYMVEVTIRNGNLPFTLDEIIVNGQTYTGPVYEGFPVVTGNNPPPTVPLPLSLRPGQVVTLYYFTNTLPGSIAHPVVTVVGKYGTSIIAVQTSAEVMYG